MKVYARYNYFYDFSAKQVVSYAGEHEGKKHLFPLGKWYAHEKTPYIDGDKIVRDRYNKQIVIVESIKKLKEEV